MMDLTPRLAPEAYALEISSFLPEHLTCEYFPLFREDFVLIYHGFRFYYHYYTGENIAFYQTLYRNSCCFTENSTSLKRLRYDCEKVLTISNRFIL